MGRMECRCSEFHFHHQMFLREDDSSSLDREVQMANVNVWKLWKMQYFNSDPPEVILIYLKLPINFSAKENTCTPLHKWLWLGLAVGLRKFNHLNLFSLFPWWKSSVRFQHEPVRAELLSAPLFMLIRYRHEMEGSRVMRKSPEWIRRVRVCGRPLRPTGRGLKALFIYEFQHRTPSTCWKGCWDSLKVYFSLWSELTFSRIEGLEPHRHCLEVAWLR